jgi:hypothetical protein
MNTRAKAMASAIRTTKPTARWPPAIDVRMELDRIYVCTYHQT